LSITSWLTRIDPYASAHALRWQNAGSVVNMGNRHARTAGAGKSSSCIARKRG